MKERDDIPVACRLSDSALREREATLLSQFRSAVTATQELADGYAFLLSGDRKTNALVADVIAAERQCCPFLAFELNAHPNSGAVFVRMTGPTGTKEFLKTVFCKPDASV